MKPKTVKASAKCQSFDIELTATVKPRGLTTHEVDDVKRKLANELTKAVAALPFAYVYPSEVRVR